MNNTNNEISACSEMSNIVMKSSGTQQKSVNPKTGKVERVFVNLEAVYPNPQDSNITFSFEELRAKHRGWLDKTWSSLPKDDGSALSLGREEPSHITETPSDQSNLVIHDDFGAKDRDEPVEFEESVLDEKQDRPRRTRIVEVNPETQTGKNFFSNIFSLLMTS